MNTLAKYGVQAAKLVRNDGYINGKWVSALSGKSYNINNPANNEIIGTAPDMNSGDCEIAISAAYEALPMWKAKSGKERAGLLRQWFNLMQKNIKDLSIILTLESGKPLSESVGELTYGGSFLEWYAEEAKRIQGEIPSSPVNSKQLLFLREPIGVVGLITPWNFPNAMITRKAGAALAAGCTCVARPAEGTPLSALALASLAEEAGIPKGVFNVITSDRKHASEIGQAMCSSDKIAGISFTGSTVVGKALYSQCAPGVKRISLELGGNAPFIVFNSADVDVSVKSLMVAKFRNTGQACISANRVFVQDMIYDQFVEKVLSEVKKLKLGNGLDDGVSLGPLINNMQLNKVKRIVEESIKMGAEVIYGGNGPKEENSLFYPPTILSNCTTEMPCFKEEIFGPVISIQKFSSEDDVIEKANDSRFGLASYFFSQDVSQVFRVSRKLESGIVGVNEGLISAAEGAFGGVKESGLGREGSRHGIDEYTNLKYVCIGNIQ